MKYMCIAKIYAHYADWKLVYMIYNSTAEEVSPKIHINVSFNDFSA